MTTAGCASSPPEAKPANEKVYSCQGGIRFVARFHPGRVEIETRRQIFSLEQRQSSLGVRYGSETVAFADDDGHAVLVGAGDGRYRDCFDVTPEESGRAE